MYIFLWSNTGRERRRCPMDKRTCSVKCTPLSRHFWEVFKIVSLGQRATGFNPFQTPRYTASGVL
jgi:hypothetical protein